MEGCTQKRLKLRWERSLSGMDKESQNHSAWSLKLIAFASYIVSFHLADTTLQ